MIIFYFLIFLVITICYYSYSITNGNMNLLEPSLLGCTYTSMWDNFLLGKVDVDPGCIGYEGFYLPDGKAYTYFGIFPSFFRGFIEIFFARGSTDWSKISIVTGGVISVIASTITYYLIASKISSEFKIVLFYTSIFAITIAFGSPVTSHMAIGWIYNEASIWGLAWSFVFILLFTKIILDKKITPITIFVLSLSSSFAMLSKITFGMSTGIALILLLSLLLIFEINKKLTNTCMDKIIKWFSFHKFELQKRNSLNMLAAGFIPLFLCVLFILSLNYLRWGNFFEFSPFEYRNEMQFARKLGLKETGLHNIKRIPHSFVYYFIPEKFHFSKAFPYTRIEGYDSGLQKYFPSVHIDWIDPSNPLIINSPCFLLLSILGIFSFLKVFNRIGLILIFAFGIQFIMILEYSTLTLRYLTEVTPLLTVLSLASFYILVKLEKTRKYIISLRFFLILITLIGIYTASITILQLKLWTWAYSGEIKQNITNFFDTVNKKGLFGSFTTPLNKNL